MTTDEIIDKYVEAHAECRWMDAGDLRDLLNAFAKEIEAANNLTWEDVKAIHHIAEELKEYLDVGIITPFCASATAFYTEVLRKFNEAKK